MCVCVLQKRRESTCFFYVHALLATRSSPCMHICILVAHVLASSSSLIRQRSRAFMHAMLVQSAPFATRNERTDFTWNNVPYVWMRCMSVLIILYFCNACWNDGHACVIYSGGFLRMAVAVKYDSSLQT